MHTVKISKNLSVKLPSSFKGLLNKGNRFVASVSEDTIMLKQIREPIWQTAPYTGKNKKPLSLEKISSLVHEVRRSPKTGKK